MSKEGLHMYPQQSLIPKKSRAVKTDKPRPFMCPICSRGFVRQEHLKRHQNSHTHEKPFGCLICGKCFARKDLVLRHVQKLHRDYKVEQLNQTVGVGKWDERVLVTPDPWNDDIVKIKGNKAAILPTVDYKMSRGSGSGSEHVQQHMHMHQHLQLSPGSSDTGIATKTVSPGSSDATFSAQRSSTNLPRNTVANANANVNANAAGGTVDAAGTEGPGGGQYHDLDLSSSSSLNFSTPTYQHSQVLVGNFTSSGSQAGSTPLDVNWLNAVLESDNKISDLNKVAARSSQNDDNTMINAKSLSPHGIGARNKKMHGLKLELPDYLKNRRYSAPINKVDEMATTTGNIIHNTENSNNEPIHKTNILEHSIREQTSDFLISTPSLNHDSGTMGSQTQVPMASLSAGILKKIDVGDMKRDDTNVDIQRDDSFSNLFKSNDFTNGDQPVMDIISQLSSEFTSPNDLNYINLNQPTIDFFTQEWRDLILQKYHIPNDNFPTLEELNEYIALYQREFHPYFAFLHLYSIQASLSKISLFLSVAAIGAFYSFNSTHSNLLANLAYGEINQLLKSVRLESSPLWLVQTMLILGFYAIFNNDISLVESASNQFMMIVKLVKSTKINQSLESQIVPPTLFPDAVSQRLTPDQIDTAYRYFITAQSRIHICHSMLFLSNIFPAMSGLEACFLASDIDCGVPSPYEDLYTSKSPSEWYENVLRNSVSLTNDTELVNLAKGAVDFGTCLKYLSTGSYILYDSVKLSLYTLLSLLVSIHEMIITERRKLKTEGDVQKNDEQWKLTRGPVVDSMIRNWEILYMKNGGILLPTENNIAKITGSHVMRNNVSFYLFAKIKRCIDLNHVIQKIWMRDWTAMNIALEEIMYDTESLQEATDYAISLLSSWASTFTILNDESIQAMKTPMFSMACIFSSILIVAEFLRSVERWAKTYNMDNPDSKMMNSTDKILWLKAGRLLKKFQKKLLSSESKKYSEFAGVQKHEMLDITEVDESVLQRAIGLEAKVDETIQMILAASLSSKALYIGVRVIGDTPIWPIAVLFAQGLQSRAVYCVMKDEGVFH
uniref:Zinc-finger protein n=1 Tax=Nakaseomyces delphensis TaxID=51657 RepID=A7WPD5_NAKDE|nr:zinc-finger protein [Nakaseomyces delphensis]